MNPSNNIDDCLERFGLAECKPVSTPADIRVHFSEKYCPEAGSAAAVSMKAEYYRGVMGSILYIDCETRPDTLANLTQLSRLQENAGKLH